MCTPNSAAWFDGGFTLAPSRTAPRVHGGEMSTPSPVPEQKVELEVAGPATRFAETLAVFGAMAQGGLLRGLRVDGRLVFTQESPG